MCERCKDERVRGDGHGGVRMAVHMAVAHLAPGFQHLKQDAIDGVAAYEARHREPASGQRPDALLCGPQIVV